MSPIALIPWLRRWMLHPAIPKDKRHEVPEDTFNQGETRFRTMFEEAPLGIALISSLTGRIHDVNAKFAAIAGRSVQELRTIDWMSITHPDDIAEDLRNMDLLNAKKIPNFKMKKRYIKPNGSLVWIDMSIAPLETQDRSKPLHLCMIEDITLQVELDTVQKQIKHRINILNRRLHVAVASAGFGVWELDLNKQELTWDETMYKIYGHSLTSFDGSVDAWKACVHPEDLERVSERFQELLAGETVELFEFRIIRASDQALRYLEATGYLELTDEDEPYLIVGMNRDISERKQNEIALEKAKKEAEVASQAKSMFLANMSHEIRTPIAVIRGFSEILSRGLSRPEDATTWIKTILRSSQQLELLLNDILDISKIEAGKIDINYSTADLLQMIAGIKAIFQLALSEKGLELNFSAEGQVPRSIVTDLPRLNQILTNIIGNAIKFTERGRIDVKIKLIAAHNAKPLLAFIVSDTGIGMSPAQGEHIFQAFTQADASITRRFGGTGLGLTLSRHLAHLLGGELNLDHTELGRGSSFSLKICPGHLKEVEMISCLATDVDQHVVCAETLLQTSLEGLRILLVEDAPDLRMLLNQILGFHGARVQLACNGKEGVEKARSREFDIILMDLQMPILDGYESTLQLRSEGLHLPIVALTAHAMQGEQLRCLEAGFNDYLTKPLDIDKLIHLLQKISSRTPIS